MRSLSLQSESRLGIWYSQQQSGDLVVDERPWKRKSGRERATDVFLCESRALSKVGTVHTSVMLVRLGSFSKRKSNPEPELGFFKRRNR